jgi:hypothetical protein
MSCLPYVALGPRVKTNRRHPRHTFSPDEDVQLKQLVARLGEQWREVAAQMANRNARQCKERWTNYLSPSVRLDPWTEEEDQLLVEKVNACGFAWSVIAQAFNGRSDNDVKNRWYSHLKYETVLEGTKHIFAPSGAAAPYPDRRKRHRVKACPKQCALRLLELQQRFPMIQAPVRPAEMQSESQESEDIWDRLILEERDDEEFPLGMF